MRRFYQQISFVLLLSAPLFACAAGGGLSKVDVDESLQTNSIAKIETQNPTQESDANIVRNAVSAMDIGAPSAASLNWANQDTGSKGTISDVVETNAGGQICRTFKTSRESFEGVALYSGSTCLNASKQWYVNNFVAL